MRYLSRSGIRLATFVIHFFILLCPIRKVLRPTHWNKQQTNLENTLKHAQYQLDFILQLVKR